MRIAMLLNNFDDGPDYLGTWLTQHGVDFDAFNSDEGGSPPATLASYAGLALLGGQLIASALGAPVAVPNHPKSAGQTSNSAKVQRRVTGSLISRPPSVTPCSGITMRSVFLHECIACRHTAIKPFLEKILSNIESGNV